MGRFNDEFNHLILNFSKKFNDQHAPGLKNHIMCIIKSSERNMWKLKYIIIKCHWRRYEK